jgi:hypothetical protein
MAIEEPSAGGLVSLRHNKTEVGEKMNCVIPTLLRKWLFCCFTGV